MISFCWSIILQALPSTGPLHYTRRMGQQAALVEAEKLKLENNHFYFLLLGELYKNVDNNKAKFNFQMAYALAKTQTEKQVIQEKIDSLS